MRTDQGAELDERMTLMDESLDGHWPDITGGPTSREKRVEKDYLNTERKDNLSEGARTVFFFSSRRRHTRWNCDWSSTCALPICGVARVVAGAKMASDLQHPPPLGQLHLLGAVRVPRREDEVPRLRCDAIEPRHGLHDHEIGRASCRERAHVLEVARSSRSREER